MKSLEESDESIMVPSGKKRNFFTRLKLGLCFRTLFDESLTLSREQKVN